MSRKTVIVALVAALFLGSLAALASARSIANTSQKGSLLLFPKIVTQGNEATDEPLVDTIIYISNDNPIDVYLKCYWVDENQTLDDFQFRLTANQPVAFSAWGSSAINDYDAPGLLELQPFKNKVGQLLCWAVDAGDSTQIQFNHLYGQSLIIFPATSTPLTAAPVPAWSFRALKDPSPAGGGVAGKLPLDGVTYDACPQYMVTNFTPAEQFPGYRPHLALAPCRQDLRQDRIPTCAKAKFDVWNFNEVKFTGAYQCLKCWYEGYLDQMGKDAHQKGPGYGGLSLDYNIFTYNVLKSFTARFRVQGVYSAVCVGKTRGCPAAGDDNFTDAWGGAGKTTPFVGVLLYAKTQCDEQEHCAPGVPLTGYPLHGAGADASGQILWDVADPVEAEVVRR